MMRLLLLVAMLSVGVATHAAVGETDSLSQLSSAKARREARRAAYSAEIDDIVRSRNYIFRPITMQNVVMGNTHSIYAYYLFLGLSGDKVVLHLPVEFTSYVIDTVNLDTFAEGYMIQTALKKGPMFRHMDISAICAPRYQRWALDLAAKKGIPVQESVREGGGNNAASIQTALVGAPSIVEGIPVRYAHATDCISAEYDYEAGVQMLIALLENITADVIRSI